MIQNKDILIGFILGVVCTLLMVILVDNITVNPNWPKLESGMTKEEVVDLLGEPKQIKKGLLGYTTFFYSSVNYHSYCEFYRGRLSSWSTPGSAF